MDGIWHGGRHLPRKRKKGKLRKKFEKEKYEILWFIPLMMKYYGLQLVKLLFTTLCFVGLYSVPNLIVMLFNLLYHVFIVGFHYKGCVLEREREYEDSKDWRDSAGSSRLSILQKEACALHITGMRRVRPDGDSCVSRVSRK